MSMRKWQRKMAHNKADMFGIKRQNKPRWFNGKKLPSWFATNWEKLQLPRCLSRERRPDDKT